MTCKLLKGGAFLHIPKTGGTWVSAVLDDAQLIKGPIGHEHNYNHREKWAFTVVRDPALWWLSVWKHNMDHQWEHPSGGPAHPIFPISHLYETDVEVWLERAAREY